MPLGVECVGAVGKFNRIERERPAAEFDQQTAGLAATP
jgi:hypothetical protein